MKQTYENEFISCTFNENVLIIDGEMRQPKLTDYKLVRQFLWSSVLLTIDSQKEFVLDIQGLKFLNSSGQAIINMFILELKRFKNELRIRILGSDKYEWQLKFVHTFRQLWKDKEELMIICVPNYDSSEKKITNIKEWK